MSRRPINQHEPARAETQASNAQQDARTLPAVSSSAPPVVTVNPLRRALLKLGASSWLLPSMGAAGLLSACGGSDNDDPATETPGEPQPDPETPGADGRISSFGLAVLPDTQFYSRYSTVDTGNQFDALYGSEPFRAQTQWIVDNAQALKVPFVIHVGDIVDRATVQAEWEVADAAMKVLEDGGVPYSILAGNHDVRSPIGYGDDPVNGTDEDRDLAMEPYLDWFSAARAASQPTFGQRDASGFHEYHIFTAEGQRFLVLSMSWRASDAALAWARQVLRDHPTLPAILVNHDLLNIDRDGVSPLETPYGLMLWDKLIRDNDQIFMTLNGHFHGTAHLTKLNDFGNAVEQMVVDFQMAYQGGNGLMRFYEFDLTGNRIKALSFSPWVPQKPADKLNEFDQAMLTGPNEQFEIEMHFAQRFARFNPEFAAAEPSNLPLTEAATALVLGNFQDLEPPVRTPAADADDYPKIVETLAHWRFVGTAGNAVADGATVADLSGNGNDLTRGALNVPPTNTAQLSDLQWVGDKHFLSASPGSVSFRNASGAPRLSYFHTAAGAPLNAETFDSGYTVEAFVKLDKNWTADTNAWMNIMTRGGRRGNIPGFSGGPQSPPLQFAISNLREVQWEVATQDNKASRTNWSGEIMLDTWLHIAIVNDPATRATTMYVEGAPVLRNAVDGSGLATLDEPWYVGAGFWDAGPPSNGFLGDISEIRVVSRPLAPAEWLTARETR